MRNSGNEKRTSAVLYIINYAVAAALLIANFLAAYCLI